MAKDIIVTVTDNLGFAVNNAFFYQNHDPILSRLIGNGVYAVSLVVDPDYVAVGALHYGSNWFYASYVTDVYRVTLTVAFIAPSPSDVAQAPSIAPSSVVPTIDDVTSSWPMQGDLQIKGNIAVGHNKDDRLEIFQRHG